MVIFSSEYIFSIFDDYIELLYSGCLLGYVIVVFRNWSIKKINAKAQSHKYRRLTKMVLSTKSKKLGSKEMYYSLAFMLNGKLIKNPLVGPSGVSIESQETERNQMYFNRNLKDLIDRLKLPNETK